MRTRPRVLFVCVHNAGRSQMATAFLTHLAGDQVEVRSAGSLPADQINPAVVAAMAEVGIDITAGQPTQLTVEAVQAADVVITVGPWVRRHLPALSGQALPGLEPARPCRPRPRHRPLHPRPDRRAHPPPDRRDRRRASPALPPAGSRSAAP